MTLGALDLSIVTDRIIAELEAAETRLWAARPAGQFDIDFTGRHPHDPLDDDASRVSVYLFHVSPDPAHRNTFPLGGRARIVPEQPLALTLHYLLAAQSESYRREQLAMSVALKCLHEHPIMTATVPSESHVQRFTVTMEPQSADEIGRLWLALAAPLRLSAVYRAEVLFLEPEEPESSDVYLVLEPHVDAVPLPRPPLASRPTSTDVAVVTGAGFDGTAIELSIDGRDYPVVAAPPIQAGEAVVVSPTELRIRFLPATRRGEYVLRVRLAPGRGQPVQEVVLRLTRTVPP